MSPKRLSNVIRKLREAKGMTQDELATKVKVQRPYITMLESGAKKNPSLDVLKRIAKALGVPVTDLLS